ncbi:MAG: hypothetical protein KDI71_17905 [Xanthomonadales bacterium]|nr:hypothetical protein [Xanthomonadales bacterium]
MPQNHHRPHRWDRILASLVGVLAVIWLALSLIAAIHHFAGGGGTGGAWSLAHGMGALCALLLSRAAAAAFEIAGQLGVGRAAKSNAEADPASVPIALSRNADI